MPNLKISELTNSAPLVGNEELPIVQSAQTVKTTTEDVAKLYENYLLEDIIYDDLYTKVINGELVPGKYYRLTDYKSVNFLNGYALADNNPTPTDPNFDPREIYVGEEEVLIIQATGPYSISETSYSETYNSDVITYLPFMNKLGVYLYVQNGETLPDSSVVSGFDLQWDGTNVYFDMPTGYPILFGYGAYLVAQFSTGDYLDCNYGMITPNITNVNRSFDLVSSRLRVENNGTRVVLLDLVEADVTNYIADSLYIDHAYAIGDAYGFINRRQDLINNLDIPFDFRGRTYRRFEVDLSGYNPGFGTGFYGIGDNYFGQGTTGNYQDFKTFSSAKDIVWRSSNSSNYGSTLAFVDNVVFVEPFTNNVIDSSYFMNGTFIDDFRDNSLKVGEFYDIICNDLFTDNTIELNYSYENTIANDFQYNLLKCDGFYTNRITNGFEENLINCRDFNNNIINDFFRNQVFSRFFSDNVIPSGFNYNIVKSNVEGEDFTSATHVYAGYTCEITENSNGDPVLVYLNGSNVPQYVAPNA